MALDLQLRAAFARSTRDAEGASESGGDPAHKLLLAEKGRKGLAVAFKLLIRARQQVIICFSGNNLSDIQKYVPWSPRYTRKKTELT